MAGLYRDRRGQHELWRGRQPIQRWRLIQAQAAIVGRARFRLGRLSREIGELQMQQGISPKVAYPALVLAVVGAVCLLVGVLMGEEQLTAVGGSLIAASGVTGAVGYRSNSGTVAPDNIGKASDDLLSAEAQA